MTIYHLTADIVKARVKCAYFVYRTDRTDSAKQVEVDEGRAGRRPNCQPRNTNSVIPLYTTSDSHWEKKISCQMVLRSLIF